MVWVHADRPGISLLFVRRRQCDVFCHEKVRNHGAARCSLEDHPANPADLFPGLSHVLVSLLPKDTGWPFEPNADRADPYIGRPATDSALLWDRLPAGLLFQAPDGDRHSHLSVDRLLDHPARGWGTRYGPVQYDGQCGISS